MEKQTLNSLNITAENITKIAELFPSAVSEGKINFEILKTLLGETDDDGNERYQFSWNGKHRAMQLAQTPSTGTLLPNKEKSKNWDETDNVYIEGDNLEVLKLLQKSYFGKIKMIYIDPPYNTGKDFVYKDSFQDTIQNYKEQTNQTTKANAETSGRYHTDWLNMMYPRLMLARNLLTEDGVIFISIDDNEQANLKKMCDEIFGEDNFLANVIWKKKVFDNNNNIPELHEYLLVYTKNPNVEINLLPRTAEQLSKYKNPDNDPRGDYYFEKLSVNTAGGRYSQATDFEIINPQTGQHYKSPTGNWRFGKNTIQQMIIEGRIDFSASLPRYRVYLSDVKKGVSVNTWWDDCGQNLHAAKEIKDLFEIKLFDTPKPINFLKRMLYITTEKNSIVLDFFSGSSTTAHAVMQLNAEDGGKRKYIMVQIPENTPEKSEAAKAGYTTIPEIAQERIRRAGELILNDDSLSQENRDNLDTGFKVFTLDSSNVKPFDSTQLFASAETFVDGRSELDICYELILKSGLALTTPIQQRDGIYVVDEGLLFISLADQITVETAEAIINLADVDLNPRVIFKDTGFSDDATKLNVLRRLQTAGISEVRSV